MPTWLLFVFGIAFGAAAGFFGGVIFAKRTTIQVKPEHVQLVFTLLFSMVAVAVWQQAMDQEAASLGAYKVPQVLHFIVASVIGLPVGTVLNMFKSK